MTVSVVLSLACNKTVKRILRVKSSASAFLLSYEWEEQKQLKLILGVDISTFTKSFMLSVKSSAEQ